MGGYVALTTVEWAQVIAPLFTATAAVASWASVRQSRKLADGAVRPWLAMELKQDPSKGGVVKAHVRNVGEGYATTVCVELTNGTKRFKHRFTDGPIKPGEDVEATAALPPMGVTGVVFCRDIRGTWHVWASDGRHARPRNWLRRPPQSMEWDAALRELYPDTPIGSLADLD